MEPSPWGKQKKFHFTSQTTEWLAARPGRKRPARGVCARRAGDTEQPREGSARQGICVADPSPPAKLPCGSRASRTYFRCSDARRSRGVRNQSANSPASASPEEKLERGFVTPRRAGAAPPRARRGTEQGAGERLRARWAAAPTLDLRLWRRRAPPNPQARGGAGSSRTSPPPPRASRPTRAPSLPDSRLSPRPHPQLQGCHLCALPGARTGPGVHGWLVWGGCPGVGCVTEELPAGHGEGSSRDKAAQTFVL